MKLIVQLFAATALLVGLNHAFAADGRKEVVLDMGKGAFKLTVSVPDFADGPYDFGKNPGIGKEMTGQFQFQEVMFNSAMGESQVAVYKATAQKIDPNKKGKKLTAEHMAQVQIKASGFEGRATKFDCPPIPDGTTAVCYKMSGDKIFDGKAIENKYAAVLVAVSWDNDTKGYTLMGSITERNIAKFNADPSESVSLASKALSGMWKNSGIVLRSKKISVRIGSKVEFNLVVSK